MKSSIRILISLLGLVLIGGCAASTKETERHEYKGGKLPRPAHIWVYDFAASPADVPKESPLASRPVEHQTPQTPEQVAPGHQVGAAMAGALADEFRGMGLPAQQASSSTKPQINDFVLQGYLLSVDEGSATKRVAIGFGSGGSQLTTAVEGFQVTAQGLRHLGGGQAESGGSKNPGAALGVVGLAATANPAGLIISGGMKAYGEYSGSAKIEGRSKETAKLIAEKLKPKFQEQGWIQ